MIKKNIKILKSFFIYIDNLYFKRIFVFFLFLYNHYDSKKKEIIEIHNDGH